MSISNYIAGLGTALEYGRSSLQAGRDAWQESAENGGNFWDNLGAGFGGAMSELFFGDYQEQKEKQSIIDAEQRAMENTRQLRDEENAYNSPEAQAERLRDAGINPMSVLTNSSPQAASSTTVQSSGGQRSKTAPPSMSSILAMQDLMAGIDLKEAQAENLRAGTGKLTVETALAEWDVKLKEQLYNYNSENYPILLKAGQQKINNLIADYNKAKSETNVNDARVKEIEQGIVRSQAEVALLELQKEFEQSKININRKQYDLLVQQLEIGTFTKEYEKWKSKEQEEKYHVAKLLFDEKEIEYDALYASGYFKQKTEAEARRIAGLANDIEFENSIRDAVKSVIGDGNTSLEDIEKNFGLILLYIFEKIA